MSDPSKSYHFEIVCNDKSQAEHLREMMNSFDVDAKIVQRKKTYVVYLKRRLTDCKYIECDGSPCGFDETGECPYCERDA